MINWIPEPSVPPAPVRTLIPMIHRERSVQRTAEGQDSLPHHQHTLHWYTVPHTTLVHGSTLHTGTRFHTPHWYTVPHTSTETRFHTLHWYTVPHSALLECPWAVPCLTDNTALQSL